MSSSLDQYRAAEQAYWRSSGANPSERFLSIGPQLRVRVQEVGEGSPALLVHGAMTCGSGFASLVAHLGGLKCVVLDRPGCGLSDPWQLHSHFREQAVDAIKGVLDGLHIESVLLVGNSIGALWSTWFAIAYPQRVRKLVLLGPSIGFPGVRAPAFMRIAAIPGMGRLIKRLMRPSRDALRRNLAEMGHQKSLAAGKIPEALFDWGVRLMADTATQRNDFEAVLRAVGVTGARRWIQLGEDALRGLSVPTLLLAGTDDSHGGPTLAARAAQLIPNASVQTLKDAGHVPWLDDPAAVADAVLRFAN
jgi:pimeloyl-ACP methyl ester carboxylesterase